MLSYYGYWWTHLQDAQACCCKDATVLLTRKRTTDFSANYFSAEQRAELSRCWKCSSYGRVLDVRSANDIWFIQFAPRIGGGRRDDWCGCGSRLRSLRDVVSWSCLRRRRRLKTVGRNPVTVMADNGTRSTCGVVDTVGWLQWRRHPLIRLLLLLLLVLLRSPASIHLSRTPTYSFVCLLFLKYIRHSGLEWEHHVTTLWVKISEKNTLKCTLECCRWEVDVFDVLDGVHTMLLDFTKRSFLMRSLHREKSVLL